MTTESFSRYLFRLLSSAEESLRLELAARSLAAFFDVEPHEIAFFRIDATCRFANLRWPASSTTASTTIPLRTFATSLLSATAQKRHALIDNAFAQTRHLHMIEHSLTESTERIPIQKIMSVPVPYQGELRWVLQVSRKGSTPEAAGPDFTGDDLKDLETLAKPLSSFALEAT